MRINRWVMAASVGASLCMSGAASAKDAPLRDVEAFIRNADRCEQVAGEWDSNLSAKKKKQIERSLGRYCGSAQKQLEAVSVKYKDNAEVRKRITEHAYDSVKYFSK